MKNKITFLVVILLWIPLSALAVNEYYSLSRSIRARGMGGAFYALSNDEYALFYNPAGLSLYTGEGEGMLRINGNIGKGTLSSLSEIQKLLDEGNGITDPTAAALDALAKLQKLKESPMHANAGLLPYYFRKHFGVGLLLADTKANVVVQGSTVLNTTAEVTAITDTGLVLGYAQAMPFLPDLHVGLNLKGIFRAGGNKTFTVQQIATHTNVDIDPDALGGRGVGIDADLGAIYELPQLPWGVANRASVTFNNLLASKFTMGQKGNVPGLVRQLSVGYYTVFEGVGPIDNFHGLLEFSEFSLGGEDRIDLGARKGSFMKHLHVGVEVPLNRLSVRLGLNQGYFTAGVGVNLRFFRLDLATFGEELAGSGSGQGSRRFAATVALGMGSAPIPVMSATRTEVKPEPENPTPNEIPEQVAPSKTEPKLDPNLKIEDKPAAPQTPNTQEANP